VPVDNPATHLELTMIHEALILEYSGRHLALLEWAASLKLFAYSCIGLALFFPWGVAEARRRWRCCWRCRCWCSSWPSAASCWR
jgi:formate hydrogenlyase subunit 4